jgi:anti-sigma factor RsiW
VSAAPRHYLDEIQDLLDGRLDPSRRAEIEEHLEACAECRRGFVAVRLTKELLARTLRSEIDSSPDSSRLGTLLDDEDRGAGRRGFAGVLKWSAAALVLLTIVAAFFWYGRRDSVTETVAHDFTESRSGSLRLELETTEPEALERFFAQRGIVFETRVFDLGMMGYQVVGGRVHALGGRPSALFLYRNAEGRLLLCQMFEARMEELEAPDETRVHDGIRFQVYRRDGLTLVFWQEGTVVCVLVSDLPSEEIVQLAFAKAVRI